MEKNIIKEEIVEILEVIVEQSEVISSYEKQIPQIEIDIILSNIRDLYSKFKALEKLNKSIYSPIPPAIEEVIVQEKKKEPEIINEPEILKEPEQIRKPEIITKPEIVDQKTVVTETKAEDKAPQPEEKAPVEEIAPVVVEEPKAKEIVPPPQVITPVIAKTEEKIEIAKEAVIEEKEIEHTEKKEKSKKVSLDLFSAHPTLADKFKDDKKSLNERHSSSQQTDKTIASKLQKNPVKDLKAAIGINEKFKFINELFDGSLQKYNDCITQLNGFAGSEAAFKYMTFLKDEFGWKEGNEAYHELNDLVTRRYSA